MALLGHDLLKGGLVLLQIQISPPLIFGNLAVSPLLAARPRAPDYLTLDEALSSGRVHISETGEIGAVPELLLRNDAEWPVLLVDGEELVGAKQNRICNLSILAPARAETVIPVSCVEAGRWRWRSRAFSASENIYFAKGRARKARDLSQSLKEHGAPRARQDVVWSDIDAKLARLRVRSETAALCDAFEEAKVEVDNYVEALRLPSDAVGAVFSLSGRPAGLELFESPALCSKLSRKIIRSWAIDAIECGDAGNAPSPANERILELIESIATAPRERFKVTGLGESVRFSGEKIAGGALVLGDRILHVLAHTCEFASAN
jgi:hypothetical protein